MPLYSLTGIGAACTLIGLCLLLGSNHWAHSLQRQLAQAGRQTLTLYIAHILIGMGLIEALGWEASQSLPMVFVAATVFMGCAALYARLWSQHFKRGPIEAVMRRLTG